MKCPFNCGNKADVPEFDNAVEHLIVVFNPNGHTHIHGPFDNKYAVTKMADAMIIEMRKNGIDYNPPAAPDKE
jgi:hypothetical protein